MADPLAELLALVGAMSDEEKAALDKHLEPELSKRWLPTPGPQADAFHSQADLVLYGGAAGGGKTDLIVGLALEHKRTVIFRRLFGELSDIAERFLTVLGTRDGYSASPQMRYRRDEKLVEFGALEQPGSHLAWRGRAHSFIAYDEGAELDREKVEFVMGWLRSTDPCERCRVLIASNPPTGGEGEWLISWFAPWLDPLFADQAAPGELRWAFQRNGETVWAQNAEPVEIEGEHYTPQSRTFIPARLDDNPHLKDTNYRAKLQSLPEPLRSQLLKGDFLAGRKDHEWQVIPTEWVNLAEERWKKAPQKRRTMIALSLDAAGGGNDDSALAALHEDCWFAPIETKKSAEFANEATISAELASWMLLKRRDNADLSADCSGGWGGGVRSHLKSAHDIDCAALVYSSGSERKTKDKIYGFKNLRAEMYWRFREALDPEEGDEVMLPPDARLKAELTAVRWKPSGTDIQIEDKAEIKKRVGSSPDRGDATVQAWHRRLAAIKKPKPKVAAPVNVGGWLGR